MIGRNELTTNVGIRSRFVIAVIINILTVEIIISYLIGISLEMLRLFREHKGFIGYGFRYLRTWSILLFLGTRERQQTYKD